MKQFHIFLLHASRALALLLITCWTGCAVQPPAPTESAPTPPTPTEHPAPVQPETEPVPDFAVSPPENLWEPDETRVTHTLHVNQAHDRAAANTSGTPDAPFDTVQAAVEFALGPDAPDGGLRILIAPGVYRETVDINGWRKEYPLLLEGNPDPDHPVILSGSDVLTEWSAVPGTDRIFQHHWPHRFGPQPNPWPGLMPMKDGAGFRRELFFVNGRPYRQVYTHQALDEGTYLVDEERQKIYFKPDTDFPNESPLIEASVRPVPKYGAHSKLIRVIDSQNIVLRNLVVQHAATVPFNSGALQVLGVENLLIEDCVVQWNNGSGLALVSHKGRPPRHVTLRRIQANHNGTMGMEGGMHDGWIVDSETNHNNWRGAALGATGWAPCGFKLSGLLRVRVENHTANYNHASGGWFDDHIRHVEILNFVAVNNYRSGLSLEAVDGPLRVEHSLFMGNSTGINLFDSVNISMENNRILNNQQRAIRIAGSTPLPAEELATITPDWRRMRLSSRRSPSDIRILNSVIGHTGPDSSGALIEFGMRDHAFLLEDGTRPLDQTLATLTVRGNAYAVPQGPSRSFRDAMNEPISLEEWRGLLGEDRDERWDSEAVAAVLQEAIEELGIRPTGFGVEDKTSSTRAVDELEL